MIGKKFKLGHNSIEFIPDSYTNNELNVRINNSSYAVSTMIKKVALIRFGEQLEHKDPYVIANESDYESFPLFSATRTEYGYRFLVKNFISISVEFTYEVAEQISEFLKNIQP